MDVPCETLLGDAVATVQGRLGTVNSVNVARLIMQTVTFFFATARLAFPDPQGPAHEVVFYVPSGAAGHAAAGCVAVRCGLPVKIVACNNANGALHAFLNPLTPGQLRAPAPRQTNSPAMDISMPYAESLGSVIVFVSSSALASPACIDHAFLSVAFFVLVTATTLSGCWPWPEAQPRMCWRS